MENINPSEALGYFTAFWSVFTIYLVSIKYKHALLLKILSYLLWLLYGATSATPPLIIANLAGIVVALNGWWFKWRNE